MNSVFKSNLMMDGILGNVKNVEVVTGRKEDELNVLKQERKSIEAAIKVIKNSKKQEDVQERKELNEELGEKKNQIKEGRSLVSEEKNNRSGVVSMSDSVYKYNKVSNVSHSMKIIDIVVARLKSDDKGVIDLTGADTGSIAIQKVDNGVDSIKKEITQESAEEVYEFPVEVINEYLKNGKKKDKKAILSKRMEEILKALNDVDKDLSQDELYDLVEKKIGRATGLLGAFQSWRRGELVAKEKVDSSYDNEIEKMFKVVNSAEEALGKLLDNNSKKAGEYEKKIDALYTIDGKDIKHRMPINRLIEEIEKVISEMNQELVEVEEKVDKDEGVEQIVTNAKEEVGDIVGNRSAVIKNTSSQKKVEKVASKKEDKKIKKENQEKEFGKKFEFRKDYYKISDVNLEESLVIKGYTKKTKYEDQIIVLQNGIEKNYKLSDFEVLMAEYKLISDPLFLEERHRDDSVNFSKMDNKYHFGKTWISHSKDKSKNKNFKIIDTIQSKSGDKFLVEEDGEILRLIKRELEDKIVKGKYHNPEERKNNFLKKYSIGAIFTHKNGNRNEDYKITGYSLGYGKGKDMVNILYKGKGDELSRKVFDDNLKSKKYYLDNGVVVKEEESLKNIDDIKESEEWLTGKQKIREEFKGIKVLENGEFSIVATRLNDLDKKLRNLASKMESENKYPRLLGEINVELNKVQLLIELDTSFKEVENKLGSVSIDKNVVSEFKSRIESLFNNVRNGGNEFSKQKAENIITEINRDVDSIIENNRAAQKLKKESDELTNRDVYNTEEITRAKEKRKEDFLNIWTIGRQYQLIVDGDDDFHDGENFSIKDYISKNSYHSDKVVVEENGKEKKYKRAQFDKKFNIDETSWYSDDGVESEEVIEIEQEGEVGDEIVVKANDTEFDENKNEKIHGLDDRLKKTEEVLKSLMKEAESESDPKRAVRYIEKIGEIEDSIMDHIARTDYLDLKRSTSKERIISAVSNPGYEIVLTELTSVEHSKDMDKRLKDGEKFSYYKNRGHEYRGQMMNSEIKPGVAVRIKDGVLFDQTKNIYKGFNGGYVMETGSKYYNVNFNENVKYEGFDFVDYEENDKDEVIIKDGKESVDSEVAEEDVIVRNEATDNNLEISKKEKKIIELLKFKVEGYKKELSGEGSLDIDWEYYKPEKKDRMIGDFSEAYVRKILSKTKNLEDDRVGVIIINVFK